MGWREYSRVGEAMASLLDLEGIPSGIGSGSCNAGRTGLPDLGTDIENGQTTFAIRRYLCAQARGADLIATDND